MKEMSKTLDINIYSYRHRPDGIVYFTQNKYKWTTRGVISEDYRYQKNKNKTC